MSKSMGSAVVLERCDVKVGHFVYRTLANIAVRETASFLHARPLSLKSGSIVEVCALVAAERTLFGLLTDGTGWVSEKSKDGKLMLEPAGVEEGVCHMRCSKAIVVMESASFAHPVRVPTGVRLCLKVGAVICCNVRVSTEGTTFFKLRDGKGWVPQSEPDANGKVV